MFAVAVKVPPDWGDHRRNMTRNSDHKHGRKVGFHRWHRRSQPFVAFEHECKIADPKENCNANGGERWWHRMWMIWLNLP